MAKALMGKSFISKPQHDRLLKRINEAAAERAFQIYKCQGDSLRLLIENEKEIEEALVKLYVKFATPEPVPE